MIIVKWWKWRDGRHERKFPMRKTKDGYVRKRDQREWDEFLWEMDGKKISIPRSCCGREDKS